MDTITDLRYSNSKGFATRSESSIEIISVMSFLQKTIVSMAFANDFIQGGQVKFFSFHSTLSL